MDKGDMEVSTEINLENCDQEPIHIPGAIQGHGALLGFARDGCLLVLSANAEALLGALPAVGQGLDASHLSPEVREAIDQALIAGHFAERSNTLETEIGGRLFDITLHFNADVFYAEFEPRPTDAPPPLSFVLTAHRALERLQRQNQLLPALQVSAEEIRALTGFDRVMAYRFHEDDSGEVVAESRRDDLHALLGMRYPASDIPAQARRLYVLNPLRFIVDVNYAPVPLAPTAHPQSGQPFDLSHSVLRSVSPIHCEYLRNMGVRASLSISIIVDGRLWGLFACHHYAPKLVPQPIRLSANLLAHYCSTLVDKLETAAFAEIRVEGNAKRAGIVDNLRAADDAVFALTEAEPGIEALLPNDGHIVALGSRLLLRGTELDKTCAGELVRWLDKSGHDLFHCEKLIDHLPQLAGRLHGVSGILAIRFQPEQSGWVIWLRLEQVRTVRWAGEPVKSISYGPNGPRLSPRGSFSEWTEVVRDRSAPWKRHEIELANELRQGMIEVIYAKISETEKARERLFAMLGHDLRDPLNSIMMATNVMSLTDQRSPDLVRRINSSGQRMQRLIGQVLDMSRIEAGLGLGLHRQPACLSEIVRDIVEEASLAHPEVDIQLALYSDAVLNLDRDRIGQVVSNLISNARHHGHAGAPIEVEISESDDAIELAVRNSGNPLPENLPNDIFKPFKERSRPSSLNPGGLGLGLYICAQIVQEHQGTLEISDGGGKVTVKVRLPCG